MISKKCRELVEEGTINWFKYNHLNFQLLCYTKAYTQAVKLIFYVTKNRNLKFQSVDTIENYNVLQAYAYVLQYLDAPSINSTTYKFKLGKFLNEIPSYSKDKRGMNISIIIIQILILLTNNKFQAIIDRLSMLERYTTRYLYKNDTFRSNCFIKMIALLPKSNFNRINLEYRSKKYVKRLKSIPIAEANQSADIEIIPYEYLWEIVLELCDISD